MNKTATETQEKNYLTAEAYKEMAGNLLDVVEDLKLVRHTLEFIRTPREVKQNGHFEVEYYKVHQYSEVLFSKVQGLISTLEDISGTLYSVDELDELKEFVKDEWINKESAKDIEVLAMANDDELLNK